MIDLSNTALNEKQIALLAPLGVAFYMHKETGKTFIKKQYWNGISEDQREALAKAVSDLPIDDGNEDRWTCHDVGNKNRFVRQHGDKVKYVVEEDRWIAWDGTRWNSDEAKVHTRAERTAKSIHREAAECNDDKGKEHLGRWAIKSQSRGQITNMLFLARESLGVSVSDFDTDHAKINCKNGIVDLKTGELIPHSPNQLVMKRTKVDYNPASKCPRWLQFIDEIFVGDRELIDWVHRALGYALTGQVDEQFFLILHGLGENGKSKLCETILNVMGDYAMPVQFDTFLAADKSNVRALSAVGDLKGIRFALASETNNSRKWDEALMKRLTGGETLTGARLYGHAFSFNPTHKLWFQANHLPNFKDATHGFKRRIRVLPFKATFANGGDKQILSKLLAEKEGVFAWLVEGARSYFEKGLSDMPTAIQEATEAYIQDNDILGKFIEDRLERATGELVGVGDTYKNYKDWCHENEQDPVSMNFFPGNMEERGITKVRRDGSNFFVGYRLKAANDNYKPFNQGGGIVDRKPSLEEWRNEYQPKERYSA